ncbi:MAG: hypothetical protein WC764_04100 [Candidatus Paceibacterota bacterium]|jgi:hypothetical protein
MKSVSKSVALGLLLLVSFVSVQTANATVQSSNSKQELIVALLKKIVELRKELAQMIAQSSSALTASVVSVPATEAPALLVEQLENPAERLLVAADQGAEFTKVKFTAKGADVTVKALTIMQTGMASESVFSYLGIYEDAAYVLAPHTDHIYILRLKKPMLIKQDESQEITLYGAMASDLTGHDGELARLSLTAIDADAPVQGSLPIAGRFQTVNETYVIGSLTGTIGSYDPALNKSIILNSAGVAFSGVRFDLSGAEPITLNSLAWRQNGSASGDDIHNVKTVVEYRGQKYEFDAVPRDSDSRFYDSDFGEDGIRIERGDSFNAYVKGDVGLGVNRTIDFNINENTDLLATGLNSSATIAPQNADTDDAAAEGQTSTASYPYYNGYEHTITGPFTNITK